jgi:clan AA aspartic protease
MILGKFVEGRVVLPVNFCLSENMNLTIDFVLDTGFNNHLTLPIQAVTAMNLPLYSMTPARLADGSQTSMPVHIAEINWDGQIMSVPVLATGIKPLLGTSLFQGFRLTIDFIPDGVVRVEKI